jgi:superfamily II DNA or RNA helicase
MNLRNYQIEAIQKLRKAIASGHKKVILCAPTGAGKTVIFSEMCRGAIEKGKTVMILTDRSELLTQAGGALNRLKIMPEYIQSFTTHFNKHPIYVAMVETIYRRLLKKEYLDMFKHLDLLILDEAHKQTFTKLFSFINEKTVVIGTTATPYRQSNQESLDKYYTKIVNVIDVKELIEHGYLAKPKYYGVEIDLHGVKTCGGDYDAESLARMYSNTKLYKGVLSNYLKIVKDKKTLVFCSSISSSKELCNEFENYGLDIKHIDAGTSHDERKEILQWFKDTPKAILSNVGLFTTGFDEPSTECIVLYRATKSLSLFLQMCGRGSRTTNEKKDFTILDFGNNVLTHGFWDDPREWSLKKKEKKKTSGIMPVKICKECGALIPNTSQHCSSCGCIIAKTQQEINAELKLLTKNEAINIAKNGDIDTWVMLAKQKKINSIWVVKYLCRNLYQAKQFTQMMDYASGWLWMHWEKK